MNPLKHSPQIDNQSFEFSYLSLTHTQLRLDQSTSTGVPPNPRVSSNIWTSSVSSEGCAKVFATLVLFDKHDTYYIF